MSRVMATHRSLNKMEFKAHMSIHNFVNIPEAEAKSQGYTRDRLGKTHRVRSKKSGRGRANGVKKDMTVLAALIFLPSLAFLPLARAGTFSKNTNVQVDSRDLEPFSLDDRLGRHEEKFHFYKDNDKMVGFNDDGDPNVSMRF